MVIAVLFRRLFRFFIRLRGNEDRPPIIVREGSIVFEHKVINGKQLDWDDSQSDWTPKQPNGKRIDFIRATIVKGGSSGCPKTIESRAIEITFSTGSKSETFTVFEAGKKPKIRPKGLLTRDSSRKKLTHGPTGGGSITRIRARQGGLECELSGAVEIEIDFVYEDEK
jgi:hypothetical protein